MKFPYDFFVAVRRLEFDIIVINSVGRVESDYTSCLKPLVLDDFLKHNLGIFEQLAGLLTDSLVIEDFRIGTVRVFPSNLPALEEGVPVDVWNQFFKVVFNEDLGAQK